MNHGSDSVNVVSILGSDYSIKAPIGQEQALKAATLLLTRTLAETKKKYPTLIGDKLLVLTALNLCSQQVELQDQHRQEMRHLEEHVSATVEGISRVIKQG
jgi:cell division protein ZapA